MKNPAPYIRQQLYSLLNETVTHGGVAVPAYESEWMGESVPYKIEIAGMDGFAKYDKASANYDYSQDIEVIGEDYTWARKDVDAIGSSIMQIVKPTLYTTAFANSAEWQVTNLVIQPPHYLEDESASGKKIMRLILRLDFLISER